MHQKTPQPFKLVIVPDTKASIAIAALESDLPKHDVAERHTDNWSNTSSRME